MEITPILATVGAITTFTGFAVGVSTIFELARIGYKLVRLASKNEAAAGILTTIQGR